MIVEASAHGREVECSVLGNEDPRDLACRARSSPTPSGTTTRRSTARAAWTWRCRRRSRRSRRRGCASSPPTVFPLAGCSGLARCDFFVEPDGTVLVNEINTMPGFTETSVYAKLLEAGGLAYPDLCDRLVAARDRAPPARPLLRVLGQLRRAGAAIRTA